MRISSIEIQNFRLLQDAKLSFHDNVTVIVGRNNTGKTSSTELFRRFFSMHSPEFHFEDFSVSVHEKFLVAYSYFLDGKTDDEIRSLLPAITLTISFRYEEADCNLGVLSPFIIDLDENTYEARVRVCYCLNNGKVKSFFSDCPVPVAVDNMADKAKFFKFIREQIPKFYAIQVSAIDPTDGKNVKNNMGMSELRALLLTNFISAQRGLDDTTTKEKDVIGKILSKLLVAANQENATQSDKEIASKIEDSVEALQTTIGEEFNAKIVNLLPTFSQFGYPGLIDPEIRTETTLNINDIMESRTRIVYGIKDGLGLPETYNGLGTRNLIYMLLHLYQFFKEYIVKSTSPGVNLVFIEEPEAHLHPQMQEVFIRQLVEIVKIFEQNFASEIKWPVQFLVTTHSSHIANEAPFETIRYFLRDKSKDYNTTIKDLATAFGNKNLKDKKFLEKYLTLTRCDLFFADKAILVEGQSEHILLPAMLRKIDKQVPAYKTSSQYISIIEIGGAYAHHFIHLLDFLELKALVITDLDSVKMSIGKNGRKAYCACCVSKGEFSSNAGIKHWFLQSNSKRIGHCKLSAVRLEEFLGKQKNQRRICYQIPEDGSTSCARSFEDAFILANKNLFGISQGSPEDEQVAYNIAQKYDDKKLDFALHFITNTAEWKIPKYICEGLLWLVKEVNDTISATISN